jgi:hypothetical protein
MLDSSQCSHAVPRARHSSFLLILPLYVQLSEPSISNVEHELGIFFLLFLLFFFNLFIICFLFVFLSCTILLILNGIFFYFIIVFFCFILVLNKFILDLLFLLISSVSISSDFSTLFLSFHFISSTIGFSFTFSPPPSFSLGTGLALALLTGVVAGVPVAGVSLGVLDTDLSPTLWSP